MKKINVENLRKSLRMGGRYSPDMQALIVRSVEEYLFPTEAGIGGVKCANAQVITFLIDLDILED